MRGIKNTKLKKEAITLRKKGCSYPMIEDKLGTPRSTLNFWFRDLVLSKKAQVIILERKRKSLTKVRKKAVSVLREKKKEEIKKINDQVDLDYKYYNFSKKDKELQLAMLYLGEGFKRKGCLGLGNSNYKISLVFVKLLREIYSVNDSKLRCFLHLRYDQNEFLEKKYWSEKLNISLDYFRKTQFDKRTKGRKTWEGYHGVCSVYCYDAKIDKRLTFLQDLLIKKLLGV